MSAFSTRPGPVRRHLEHEDGLVEARVGVRVRAEARADRLQERDELARPEMLRAVEGHVLEHVGEAALVLLLEHGARVDGQAQGDAVLRAVVVADVVRDAVREAPAAHRGVERHRLVERVGGGGVAGVWPRRGGRGARGSPAARRSANNAGAIASAHTPKSRVLTASS